MSIKITATELEDFDEVEVIEVLVAKGDQVEKDQSLLTLESDKAMMEIPAPEAGTVKSLHVSEGDKVKQGDLLVELDESSSTSNTVDKDKVKDKEEETSGSVEEDDTESKQEQQKKQQPKVEDKAVEENRQSNEKPREIKVTATELEDFDEVEVIEVLVAKGDQVEKDQSLLTLESDKAMMEIPAPEAGTVKSLHVSEGDKVKQGDSLLLIISQTLENSEDDERNTDSSNNEEENIDEVESKPAKQKKDPQPGGDTEPFQPDAGYASPGIRKYARELGVDVSDVKPSAENGRVTKEDVQTHVKKLAKKVKEGSTFDSAPKLPDFSQYGEVDSEPLSNIRKASAKHLRTAWHLAPHVTQFDDVDITELEKARKKLKAEVEKKDVKLTILPFIMKALVKSLQQFPHFNSSLNQDATEWIIKRYYHIGIAVDTPNGLVVPVFKDVDETKIPELAVSLKKTSEKARAGKLSAKDMQGGCMTITSLGGIGGRHFTPIINFPEVAILGVSRSFKQLQLIDGELSERIILPLSLSYDHRAIDGAEAAAFITDLKNRLSDIWSLII